MEVKRKCCLAFGKYRKLIKENLRKLKKVPSLPWYYETILYGWRNNNMNQIKNCSVCSHPRFIRQLIVKTFFEKISGKNEMTLPEKEKFRQYLIEKYIKK
jgi:hypothetical protein